MLATGITLLVVALVGGGTAGAVTLHGFLGALDVRSSLVVSVEVGGTEPGTATADLAAGDYTLVALGSGLVDRGGSVLAGVTVTGPSGAVPVDDLRGTSTTSTPDEDSVALARVTVVDAGPHTLLATSGTPGVRTIGLVPGSDTAGAARSIVGFVVTVLLGGLLLVAGIALTVAGAVRRSRARR